MITLRTSLNLLSIIAPLQLTIIIYEAPHRLLKTLGELGNRLGMERKIAVCKELTKKHETVFRSDIKGALEYYGSNEPKGEYVLVIEGLDSKVLEDKSKAFWLSLTVEEHMEYYMNQGIDKKEAMKLAAKDRGIPKREIYNMTLK